MEERPKNDKEFLKTTPSLVKCIAVQVDQMDFFHFFHPNTCGVNKRVGLLVSNIAKNQNN